MLPRKIKCRIDEVGESLFGESDDLWSWSAAFPLDELGYVPLQNRNVHNVLNVVYFQIDRRIDNVRFLPNALQS